MIADRRAMKLNHKDGTGKRVVYWMSRDQRVDDNWALVYAMEQARAQGKALGVLFNVVPEFLGATRRQYEFMIKGLEELEACEVRRRRIRSVKPLMAEDYSQRHRSVG